MITRSFRGQRWPLGLASLLLRLVLEPFMVSAIGVVMGLAMPHRAASVLWSLGVSGLYFLILNLMRQLPMGDGARFAVEKSCCRWRRRCWWSG